MPGKPSYTTYEERRHLKDLIMQGLLPTEIATQTGRSVESVRYELRSGMTGESWDTYDPKRAHNKREKVGKLGRRYVLDDNPEMRDFIAARLLEHCRPVDIVEMLKADEKFSRSAITAAGIYAAIKRGILPRPNVRSNPRKNRRYSKMVSRGMVCIPIWVREKFHYQDGDAFRIDATEDGVILITPVKRA